MRDTLIKQNVKTRYKTNHILTMYRPKEPGTIDKFGGVTLDDGSYVPAVSHLDLCIILGCPILVIFLIPLSFYLTMKGV